MGDESFFSLLAVVLAAVFTFPGTLLFIVLKTRIRGGPSDLFFGIMLGSGHGMALLMLFFFIPFEHRSMILQNWFHTSITPLFLFIILFYLVLASGFIWLFLSKNSPRPNGKENIP